jgi:hypothetical protein
MSLEKEFIPYEQALALKELGFNKKCYALYPKEQNDEIIPILTFIGSISTKIEFVQSEFQTFAPTFSQAFRWFREKYNIDGFVRIEPLNEKYGFVIYNREKDNFKEFSADYTKTEDAEFECLIKLIEIVKQPKKD